MLYLWDGTTMQSQIGATNPTSGTATATPNGVIIGNICQDQVNPAENTDGFPGDLSHIRIFNTELTAAQVLADAQGTVAQHNPGDANGDGQVDVNDLTIVLSNFGQSGKSWSQGDMDGDSTGTVDVNDLTIVLANFGKTYSAGVAAVPEPGTLALLAAGLAVLLAETWRRK